MTYRSFRLIRIWSRFAAVFRDIFHNFDQKSNARSHLFVSYCDSPDSHQQYQDIPLYHIDPHAMSVWLV